MKPETYPPSSGHSVRKFAVSLLSAMLGLVSGQQASAQALPVDLPALKLSTYGIVRTMALQADGKILVGGEFTSVNDIPRKNIARLNPDGTLDLSWAPSLDGPCYKIITDDQHVYIAGNFSMISDEAYEDFGRVTVATGVVDTSVVRNLFADPATRLTLALEQIGGSVFIGSSNGTIKKLVKSSGQVDSIWTPEAGITGVEVLLGVGDFLYAGYGTSGIRRFSLTGTGATDPGFNPPTDLEVSDIAHDSGVIVVVPGVISSRSSLPLKIDVQTGSRDANWTPSVERLWGADYAYPIALRSVAIHDGYVYLGGSFSAILGGGSYRPSESVGRVLFTGVGAVDTKWSSDIDYRGGSQFEPYPVFELLISNNGLLVGGGIGTMAGKSRMGMSLVSAQTGHLDPKFGVQVQRSENASINALARQKDGKLLVGGDFLFVNGVNGVDGTNSVERQHLLRLNADGTLDQSWKSNCSKPVSRLAIGGEYLFAAFEGGSVLNRIKLATGEQVTAVYFAADSERGVYIKSLVANEQYTYFTHDAVVPPNQSMKLYIAGPGNAWYPQGAYTDDGLDEIIAADGETLYEVFYLDGQRRQEPSIRRLNQNGDGGVAWELPVDGGSNVAGMAFDAEHLYVFGRFTIISNNVPFNDLCRLRKSDGLVDPTWRPLFEGEAHPAQVAIGKGGVWITRGGKLLFVDGTTGVVGDGGISASVNEILSAQEGLYVGGGFSEVNGTPVSKFALLATPEAPVVGIDQASGKILVTKGNGNGGEVPFFRVSGITGGTLKRSNGEIVLNGDYLSFSEGLAGLTWTPGSGTPGFEVRAALSLEPAALGTASTLVNPTNGSLLPLILFESAEVSGLEDEGSIAVKVRYTGNSPTSVRVGLAAGTAVPVTFGSELVGDYFDPGTQTLSFTGPQTKLFLVPLWDDSAVEPDEVLYAELSNATGALIGGPGRSRVLLVENDVFGNSTPGEMRLPAPILPAPATGSLAVHLTGDDNKGQWRLVGEVDWRDSSDDAGGAPATGLTAGNHQVEFRPVEGFVEPVVLSVPMIGSESVTRTGVYSNGSLFQPGTGMLEVMVEPNDVATDASMSKRGQWRRRGDTVWRNNGERLPVSAGLQVVQFKDVEGRETPPDRTVSVRQGQSNGTSGIYLIRSQIPNARQVQALPLSAAIESDAAMNKAPYCFNGQIATELGFGSGVVTQEHTVLTAAHVLFDDIALAQAKRVKWFFQRHKGENEAPGQIPRGWYRFEGYASQRALDVADPSFGPGVGTIDSQNLDVAVMYFLEPAGRGGYGGYQVSESTANTWLLSNRDKFLAGYPVSGIEESKRGRLHATPIANDRYSLERDFVLSTEDIESRPGNSGGPVYARDDSGGFFPVAIYLGGARDTKVRAINNRVVSLMNLAENAGKAGGNGTGGGATYTSLGFTEDDLPRGFVTVEISGRPDGLWRLVDASGTALSDYNLSGSFIAITPGDVFFELKPLPGLPATARRLATVYNGQITTMTAAYPETFESWVQIELIGHSVTGLTGPLDDYDADGVNHLLEYAFGMNPRLSDRLPLDANPGSKGLPSITMTGNGPSARIRVEYVRRQVSSASGLFYTVEFGPAPNGPWEASLQPGTPTPIDGIWERVAVESNETVSSHPKRFARVRVTGP